MSDILGIILFLFGPLTLICGAYFAISYAASHRGVARWLRINAVAWFAVLGVIFAVIIIGTETCSGNMLYGYGNCTVLPTNLANASIALFVFGTAIGIITSVVLALTCAVIEWRHRRAIA